MFYSTEEDLINAGMLNQNGVKDKLIEYTANECINCGRMRVERYESGMEVCEKCDTDQKTGEYVTDRYYSNL